MRKDMSKELEMILNKLMKLSDDVEKVSWIIIKLKKEYENEIKRNN